MVSRTLQVAAAVAAACALTAGVAAQKAASTVAGKWTLSVNTPHGDTPMGLELRQDGRKISGTLATPHGEVRLEGELADGKLTLATTDSDSPQMTLNGALKDDGTMAGYLSSERGDMKWTAERRKEK
ncbi:MAG TPA: hypothetical protein VHJ77_13150 [Vicinamibacterales bacterium]|nr:hypothetical protein [Vicinamibacterales bacterium]